MVQIREILRQKLGLQRSNREVAAALRISASTVSYVVCAVRARGVDAAAAGRMTDAELEAAQLEHVALVERGRTCR